MSNFTAEQQYNTFARIIEWLTLNVKPGDKEMAQQYLEFVRDTDLYLFTEEKADRATEYARQTAPPLQQMENLFPVMVADPVSVVCIYWGEWVGDGLFVKGTVNARGDEAGVDGVINTGFSFTIRPQPDGRSYLTESKNLDPRFVTVHGKQFKHHDASGAQFIFDACLRTATNHVITALEELHYAHKPRNVVVVTETKLTRRHKNKKVPGTVPRAEEKEHHVVLDPDEVRVLKKQASSHKGGSHASPVAHRRRPHKRTFRAARYKKAKGKTIEVGETHVNCKPGEKISLPKVIYHVKSIGADT